MPAHGTSLALRLTAVTAGLSLVFASAACGADHRNATTSAAIAQPNHGAVAIFTPSDGITVSQHTPVNKWDKLVSQLVRDLKAQGIAGDDITTATSPDLDRQSRDIQDYVVDHAASSGADSGAAAHDSDPVTLVVAPAAEHSNTISQYGDFAGQSIPVSTDADQSDADNTDTAVTEPDTAGTSEDAAHAAGTADTGGQNSQQADSGHDTAAARLIAALKLAQNNGMHVVMLSNTLQGYAPDVYVRMATAALIGRVQATRLVSKLQLARASAENPKVIEILLPYSPDDTDAAQQFARQAFSAAWTVLLPYFRNGTAVSASGTLTAHTTASDWRNVACDSRKPEQVQEELRNRLNPSGDAAMPRRIDGILAMNDAVATAVTEELTDLGYRGSAADINPTITIGGIVGNIAGRKDITRHAVPDPIKSPENDDAANDTGEAQDEHARWPIVTGYGGYIDAMPGIVEGKQWMTALVDRNTLASNIAKVCDALNLGRDITTLDYVSSTQIEGKTVPAIREPLLAVSASNLKTTLIDPGYISMADAGL